MQKHWTNALIKSPKAWLLLSAEQVSEIVANAEKRAAQIVEDAKAQAITEAANITEQAKANAEQEINRAREALREQVAALAVKGAESILRREVDEKQHAQMLGALKQEL